MNEAAKAKPNFCTLRLRAELATTERALDDLASGISICRTQGVTSQEDVDDLHIMQHAFIRIRARQEK